MPIEEKTNKVVIDNTTYTLVTTIVLTVLAVINIMTWRSQNNGAMYLVGSVTLVAQFILYLVLNGFEDKLQTSTGKTVSYVTQILAFIVTLFAYLLIFLRFRSR